MIDPRAIYLTARREVLERGRSRAFIIATIIQVVVVVGIVGIAAATGGDDESFTVGAAGDESVAIAEVASAGAGETGVSVERLEDEAAARRAVEDEALDAAVVDGKIVTGDDPSESLVALLQRSSSEVAGERRLREQGLSDAQIRAALEPDPLRVEQLGDSEEGAAGLAFVGGLLLYIAILMHGVAVAIGVVEEKATRVIEVVLSAIRPVDILAGKVLGVGLLGLAQVLAIVAAGLLAAVTTGAVDLPESTTSTVVAVIVFFLLGYLLYACAFAVSGAMVSRQEDVQSSSAPLSMLLIAAYLIGIGTSDSPDSTLAVVASYVPPLAPMVVPGRVAQDAMSAGELLTSIALMVAGALFLLWLAARIYDRAVLRMGSPMRLRETLRLAR